MFPDGTTPEGAKGWVPTDDEVDEYVAYRCLSIVLPGPEPAPPLPDVVTDDDTDGDKDVVA